ncbi:hypothetical protein E2C01_094480 [Portunus trituberculatus]|uniref:Uncharacterized protein n=1 Tax=Portunus trituberculatus TaxID=210409 RepID=A0A5B7JWZ4_PORTR|nr:hypothetical protein [Portunus trituberculatus]
MAWGKQWQVKFAAEKTQALVISRSREDVRLIESQLKFGEDTFAIKDSINILGMEVDSKLSFDRHLESMARKASLRVTLLRRVRYLLDAKGLMTLYMEYNPLSWMCSAQSHLSLLDKALWIPWRRSERTTRAVVSDTLLEVPRCHSVRCQRAFSHDTVVLWNAFISAVDVSSMSTQQVKCAAHAWLRTHQPDNDSDR